MRQTIAIICLILAAYTAQAQHIGTEYELKKVIEVKGRQGIAIDKDYYYVS